MSRTRALTRGEIGLAGFHRIIGYAAAVAALCLMGASVTALYWFAGVIGLPVVAQVLVALAIEVMAASLAASATTAFRDGGRVDLSAWVGFVFFIGIAAYANVLHVIVFIDVSVAPPWFGQGTFIAAACIFAAACPLGGTWGVHRFGWLRAHGADAQWQEDGSGRMAAPQQAAPRAPRQQPSVQRPAAQPRTAPTVAAQAPAQPVARPAAHPAHPVRPAAQVTAQTFAQPAAQPGAQSGVGFTPARPPKPGTAKADALTVYNAMRAPGARPNAGELHRDIGAPGDESTTRRWVQQWWAEDPYNPDVELHAADPEPVEGTVEGLHVTAVEDRARDAG